MPKEDIYKKIGFDPLGLASTKTPSSGMSMNTQTSTPAFISPEVSTAPSIPMPKVATSRPSDAIYAKIGVSTKSSTTPATEQPVAVRDFLLKPTSTTTTTSTPSFVAQPEAPKNSALDLLTSLPSQVKKDSPLRSGFQEGMLGLSSAFNRFNQSFYEFFGDERNAAISEKAANKDADLYKALTQSGVEVQDDRKFSEKLVDPNYFYKSLGQNIPSMLGALGISIPLATIGAPVAVATGAALTFGGSQAYGNSLNQAKDFGVDDEQAKKIATFSAIGNGILESIPAGRLLNKLKGPAMNEIKQAFVKNVTDKLVSIFKQGITEGTTESLQTVYDNALQKTYNEKQDLFAGLKESFVFGGILGGGTDLAVDTIAGAKNIQEKASTLPNQQGGFVKIQPNEEPQFERTYNIQDPTDRAILARTFNEETVKNFEAGVFEYGRYNTKADVENVIKANIVSQPVAQVNLDIQPYEGPRTFYHGTSPESADAILNTGFIPGSKLPEDAFRSGGYGQMQDSVSLSSDPKLASRFTGTGSRGTVLETNIAPDAKIVTIEGVDYAEDLNQYIPMLREKKIDAVWIGGGESELVVINPDVIEVSNRSDFKVFDQYNSDTPKVPVSINKNVVTPSEVKNFEKQQLVNYKPGKQLPEFKGFTDLSTKTLEKLAGRRSVSNQFIADLVKSPDIKKAERDIIQKVLDTYTDQPNIPVKEFADKVKLELLPLRFESSLEGEPRYEFVHLPEAVKGDVENYHEKIYQSPVKTSAGQVHFNSDSNDNDSYFAHTRVDETSDGSIRRVLEMQSDLFQKGRLDKEDWGAAENLRAQESYTKNGMDEMNQNSAAQAIKQRAEKRLADISKLAAYENIWHERIIREEVKQAANDGKTILQFPTGETAMKIEGLGENTRWFDRENARSANPTSIKVEDLKAGKELFQNNVGNGNPDGYWVITEVLENGKFKAVPKQWLDNVNSGQIERIRTRDAKDNNTQYIHDNNKVLKEREETFDISNKLDTNSPIYRFYENTVAKYIKNNYGAVRVTDPQGIEWFEVAVSKSAQRKPVVAYKKYLFSKLSGTKVSIEEAKKAIYSVVPEDKVRLVFEDDLIDGVATGQYEESRPEMKDILKPIIRLYQEGGKVSLDDAFHEAGHYVMENLPESERKLFRDMARKEFGPLQNAKYKVIGYAKDERVDEYIMDEFAKAKIQELTTGKKYTGKHKTMFQKIDLFLKSIIDTFNKVVEAIKTFHSVPSKQGGFVNFFEPLDVNTLKTVSETKIPDAIADTLESKFTALSRRTIEMFSKRLAKLKNTDDIQGLAGVMAKMDQEIKETAVTRGYTRESLPKVKSKTPTTPDEGELLPISKSLEGLLSTKEKASYIDTLARNLNNPQETAIAAIEYDKIWDKINARAIIEFEELAVEKSILEEVLAQNNAKQLLKYYGPNSPKDVELYDLFTKARGTDKKVRRVDKYLEELGFIDDQGNGDFDAAQKGIESYLDVRDRFKQIKVEMRKLRPQVQAARLLKKFLDDVPVLQDQPTISAIDTLANTADIESTYKDIAGFEKEALDPYRIFQKFFGSRFNIVKEAIIDPFDASKGEMVDEITRLGNMLEKNVTGKYNIARGSEDAQRVRRYGEGKMSKQDLVNEVGEQRANEIVDADSFFRGFFNDLLVESNAILAEIYPNNPEKLIPSHKNYYRHMKDKSALGDALTAIKGLFENPSGISPQLAGKSEMTQPRSKWLAYAQRRIGEATNTDAIEGVIDYINAFAYLKHISPHISKFRYLRRRIADFAPAPGDPNETLMGNSKGVNNFLVFLDNYANRLAGKSHPLDRWISDTIPGGRAMMTAITMINNRVKANTILGKFSSVIAQGANIPAGIASAKMYSVPGMRRTLASIFVENGPIKESDFLKERNLKSLTEQFKVTWADHPFQRTTEEGRNALAWLLKAGDAIGTNFIWNSHYEKALGENIDNPVRYADIETRKIVAGRGIGEVPLGQESKVFQIVAPFQIEVGNLMWIIKDMAKSKDMAGLVILAIASYLYNEVSEEVRGSRVMFDPINSLIEGTVALSEEESWKRGIAKFAGRQVGEILSNVPLGQTFAGQIPDAAFEWATNILTDTPMDKKALFGQGDPGRFGSGFLIWKTFEDPIFRFLLPYGGLQVKSTIEGIQAWADGEVQDKEGKLNFTMDKNFVNLFKAVLFGKNSVSEARDYFDEREDLFRILDAQQIKRDDFAAAAEEKYQEVKEIKAEKGSEGAKAALKELAVSNPKLASAVIEIAKMEAKGFDGVDRLIKQLGVDNGERAKFIVEKIKDFESPTDKKEYLKELATKGLLSEKVIEQIGYLASQAKK